MKQLWFVGSGGHAKVAIDAARSTGEFVVMGCLDDNPARAGESILDLTIFGAITVASIKAYNIKHAIIAIGSNSVRKSIAEVLAGHVEWSSVVHSRAYVGSRAQLGVGTLLCAGSVVQPGARIGEHAIVNTSASIDHDCSIGRYVHVGPGCHIAGDVAVGEGAFLGIGSTVIPGCTIGEWAVIGAGAVVTGDIPANTTAVGTPAKVIKRRNPGWHLE